MLITHPGKPKIPHTPLAMIDSRSWPLPNSPLTYLSTYAPNMRSKSPHAKEMKSKGETTNNHPRYQSTPGDEKGEQIDKSSCSFEHLTHTYPPAPSSPSSQVKSRHTPESNRADKDIIMMCNLYTYREVICFTGVHQVASRGERGSKVSKRRYTTWQTTISDHVMTTTMRDKGQSKGGMYGTYTPPCLLLLTPSRFSFPS